MTIGLTQNTSSFDYLHNHPSIDSSHPRRRDNPDWDSDDDDDPWSVPDSDNHTNPYRAVAMFNGDMDDERRMAAARASLAGGKKVPSKEFVASLEKLNPKDIKEADRSKFLQRTLGTSECNSLLTLDSLHDLLQRIWYPKPRRNCRTTNSPT